MGMVANRPCSDLFVGPNSGNIDPATRHLVDVNTFGDDQAARSTLQIFVSEDDVITTCS